MLKSRLIAYIIKNDSSFENFDFSRLSMAEIKIIAKEIFLNLKKN